MRRYATDEIVATLEQVDGFLTERCDIIVIGGAAIAMRHETTHVTRDIDLFATPRSFLDAYQALRKASPSVIPVESAAVADAPHDFESRLVPLELQARFLQVWLPERHDLIMMKTVRGYDHDLQAIEDMHRAGPLDLETLVARYAEMGHVVGCSQRLRGNLLAVIARLWGESVAGQLEGRLGSGGG